MRQINLKRISLTVPSYEGQSVQSVFEIEGYEGQEFKVLTSREDFLDWNCFRAALFDQTDIGLDKRHEFSDAEIENSWHEIAMSYLRTNDSQN